MKAVKLERNVNNSHSWWWDSHAGPRHSKWLKENMADMDQKVKGMLKLIEEDADSFAKRAEMYYKKRPELVSLVEEFYRAYRALAERYDHLTGELHHVQLSMGDAFPNHLRNELDSNFPRGPFLNKHNQGHVGKEHEGFGTVMEDTCHEYLDSKVIPCVSASSKEMRNNGSNKIKILQKERSSAHQEKETLNSVCDTRIEDEQLQKIQEQLHRVQEERHKVIQDSSSYTSQINELQDQVSMLKRKNNEYVEEAKLVSLKLQSETEEKNNLIREVQNLEAKLHESDRQNIKTQVGNDCSSSDQRDSWNRFVNMEDELVKLHLENHNLRTQVMSGVQQSQKANEEIQKLHQVLIKSQAENHTMISQYQQSLKLYESAENRVKDLQIQMAFLQEENRRIRDEIAGAVFHMEREKNTFQQNVWHRIQMTDFLQAARAKQDEEENRGKGTLDETSQILNFDTIVKNFQQSLSQSQEQQKKLFAELQAGNERVKNADSRIRLLEEEIHTLRRENNNLLEKSSSAVMSIKNLEEEAYKLKQEKNNLVNEVAFRVDQRDALQQELYCLREDRNDIDRKFQMIMKHIESLGIDAASIHLVSANFQHIRQKLSEHEQICEDENLNILEVIQKMEELLNKTIILKNCTASHRIEADKLESEVKLLYQHVQGLEKEKGEILDECKQRSDHIRELEAKLENVDNLYSTLQRESQQHKDELADALERTKHLDEQIFSLQEEKGALENDIVERTLQMRYLQKQVDLLKGQAEVLANNLEEEITKEQMSQAEVKKLQHILYEIDNRNQILSDDYYRLNEKYGATEEKMMELEETNLKQQTEYDMLLCNFSRAIDFNRELELEIKNLQKLLVIPDNVERECSDADPEGTKGLRSIAGEVKNMQNKLSQLQEENKKLLFDAVTINTHIEQLQKDKSALCAENESTKDAAAYQLEKLMSLEKENYQLQEQVELLKAKLEAGMETERSLQSEIDSLQQSLTSSVCANLALEGEHQRILDEQNSIKKCLKESESKLLETEAENETLIMEALSQVSLISILESQIVEKGENMKVMEKQLKCLQGKIAKVEYWLQTCGSNPQMQEAENCQLQQWLCGFQDQGIKYETVSKTDKELQQEISILTEESSQLKHHMQVKYEDNTDDSLHGLEGEKNQEHVQISYRSIENEELQSMPKEVQEQGKYREMGPHGQQLGVQGERVRESSHSSQSEETNYAGEHGSHGSEARSKVQNLKPQIAELQIRVRDLEQENTKLKCQIRNNLAGASSMGKGYIQFEERNSKLVLVEGPLNDQEKKQDLVDEVKGGMSTEDKITCGIYCFREQNQKFWTRYDSANLQLNKLQITFQELQENFWKTRHDNQKAKAGGQTGKQTNVIEKDFRELQDEILLWLECNYIMMKEVQHRFASVNRLQAEVTAVKGEHNEDPSEDTVVDLSQAAKLQKEILSIQEENNKIADVLRAGSDQARRLEFEAEKILLRFQGETKSTNWHKKGNYPRRTSLRTFLFGKEEQRQKRKSSFGCMHPVINE